MKKLTKKNFYVFFLNEYNNNIEKNIIINNKIIENSIFLNINRNLFKIDKGKIIKLRILYTIKL
jgi:hypothetical protein